LPALTTIVLTLPMYPPGLTDPIECFDEGLVATYRAVLDEVGAVADVRGVDITRDPQSRRADGLAVRVHCAQEAPAAWMPFESWFEELGVLLVSGSYRYDVHPRGRQSETFTNRGRPANPLRPGVRISGWNLPAGTLGLIVFDRATRRPCVLSSAHVLAADASGMNPYGSRILQGDSDLASAAYLAGRLERCVLDGRGDVAIGLIPSDAVDHRGRKLELCLSQWVHATAAPLVTNATVPTLGARVAKSGFATNVTFGEIEGIGHYFVDDERTSGFDGFRIKPSAGTNCAIRLSDLGDSGALWYDAHTGDGIGVHTAGGRLTGAPLCKQSQFALACHLTYALHYLDVALTPLDTTQSPSVVPCKADPSFTPRGWVGRALSGVLELLHRRT
jgi:hypothetical protein